MVELAKLPWNEVKKADHYWLSVPACRDTDSGAGRDAMREPMRIRNDSPDYGKPRNG